MASPSAVRDAGTSFIGGRIPMWVPVLLGFLTAVGPISTDIYLPAGCEVVPYDQRWGVTVGLVPIGPTHAKGHFGHGDKTPEAGKWCATAWGKTCMGRKK